MREQFEAIIKIIRKATKGEVKSNFEFCPIINTNLSEEICRGPKRMMECPTDSFCCKDCPEFGDCDAQCSMATELIKAEK